MSFEISTTLPAVTAHLDGAQPIVFQTFLDTMRTIGLRLQSRVMARLRGETLGYRTGTLGRSIGYMITAQEMDHSLEVRVTQDSDKAIYGRIQELGGEIRPTHGSALAIPLAAALTGNGVPRFSAAEVKADPSGFGFSSTFIAKGVIFGVVAGARKAATRGSAAGDLVPLFALKPSVVLPARSYMQATLDEQRDQITTDLQDAGSRAAAAVNGNG